MAHRSNSTTERRRLPAFPPVESPKSPLLTDDVAVFEHAMDDVNDLGERPLNIFRRVGRFRSVVIALGHFLNVGALAFLWFLWTAKESNDVWRSIVLANWSTRAITLTSLLIRFIVTAQAAICTSMLATLTLYTNGVLLPHSATVSLMQFESTGPHALILPILSSLKRAKGFVVAAHLFLLFSTTTLLQFSSTVLLSDINLAPVASYGENIVLYYGYNSSDRMEGIYQERGYWQRKPNTFPTFAEDSQRPGQVPGAHDTGRSLRAFLPVYPELQRDSLKTYDGMALVFDSRFVCVQPTLEDLDIFWDNKNGIPAAPRLQGRIGSDVQVERFRIDDPDDYLTPFDCVSAVQGSPLDEWPLSVCRLSNAHSGVVSSLDDYQESDMDGYMSVGLGQAFLILNTTGSYNVWFSYLFGNDSLGEVHPIGSLLQFVGPSDYEKDEEWLRIPSNDPTITIAFSLCYAALETIDVAVNASRVHNFTEATPEWDHTDIKYNTRAVREQLGAVSNPKTLRDRGIFSFSLANFSNVGTYGYRPTAPDFIRTSTYPLIIDDSYADFTTYMCTGCTRAFDGTKFAWAHAVLGTLFSDVIRDTNHPSLALQAVWTMVFGMSYYDHIEQFDYQGNSTIVRFQDVLVPTSIRALTIVSTILLVHCLLVVVIVISFAMSKNMGMVGSAWNVVDQLQGHTVHRYARRYSSLRDQQVKQKMKEDGVDGVWVRLIAKGRRGKVLVGTDNEDD